MAASAEELSLTSALLSLPTTAIPQSLTLSQTLTASPKPNTPSVDDTLGFPSSGSNSYTSATSLHVPAILSSPSLHLSPSPQQTGAEESGISSSTSTFSIPFTTTMSSQQAMSQVQSLSSPVSLTMPATTAASSQHAGNTLDQDDSPHHPTLTFKKDLVQLGSSNLAEFAPVTVASNSPTPTPSGVQYPSAEEGNAVMAKGFNQIYKSLSMTSKCNANDENQAVSCISGELAQCQADGTYVLKSCPNGQSCYALPKAQGSTGVSVECAVPSDAAAKLSGALNSNGVPSSQVVPVSQVSTALSIGNDQSTSAASPQTQSVQIPVQRISSLSPSSQSLAPATVTFSSSTQQISWGTQEASSTIINTDSVQTSAQQSSYSGQTETVPSSLIQASTSSLPIAGQAGSPQASTDQQGPTALADTGPSSSSSTQSAENSVQTTLSSSPTQATAGFQTEALSSHSTKSAPAQTEGSSEPNSAAFEATSATPSATAALGGPLFSLPNLTPLPTQTAQAQHQQGDDRDTHSSQETLSAAQSPSISAEQQSTPTASSSALLPHLANTDSKASTSDDDKGGVRIVPMGPQLDSNKPIGNQKLAVEKIDSHTEPSPLSAFKPMGDGSPIYITVTVTTTAYGHGPSP